MNDIILRPLLAVTCAAFLGGCTFVHNSFMLAEDCNARADQRKVKKVFPNAVELGTPLFRSMPQYPTTEAEWQRQGYAVLAFKVDKEGVVSDVRVIEETGKERFNAAAAKALYETRYDPAKLKPEQIGKYHQTTTEFCLVKPVVKPAAAPPPGENKHVPVPPAAVPARM